MLQLLRVQKPSASTQDRRTRVCAAGVEHIHLMIPEATTATASTNLAPKLHLRSKLLDHLKHYSQCLVPTSFSMLIESKDLNFREVVKLCTNYPQRMLSFNAFQFISEAGSWKTLECVHDLSHQFAVLLLGGSRGLRILCCWCQRHLSCYGCRFQPQAMSLPKSDP